MTRVVAATAVGIMLMVTGCLNQEIHEFSPKWDSWLGSTKDDRIRDMGIPSKCHSFKDGAEVCEWSVPQQDGRQDVVGVTFNDKGQACAWSYRGFYGMQKSKQSC